MAPLSPIMQFLLISTSRALFTFSILAIAVAPVSHNCRSESEIFVPGTVLILMLLWYSTCTCTSTAVILVPQESALMGPDTMMSRLKTQHSRIFIVITHHSSSGRSSRLTSQLDSPGERFDYNILTTGAPLVFRMYETKI